MRFEDVSTIVHEIQLRRIRNNAILKQGVA